jgi:wyosine [tRNA(Phe)-imidazoG37] synthetase (radical SAM superfamily)
MNCAYSKTSSKKQFMPLENFINIQKHIEILSPQKQFISLIGLGEQTLHPQFSTIVDQLKNSTTKDLFISTNGTTIKELHGVLNKFDYVSVSIDAVSSAVYKKVRPGFEFNSLIDSLFLLNPLKTKQASFVINEDNAHEAKDFITFSLDHGFDKVYFEIANSPWHTCPKDLTSLWADLQQAVREEHLNHRVAFQKGTSDMCDYVSTITKIDVNGKMRICPFVDAEGEYFLEKNSVWMDERKKLILRQIELGQIKECFTCNHSGPTLKKVFL